MRPSSLLKRIEKPEEAARVPAGLKSLSPSQLDQTLAELAQFSHKIPLLPDEAFSRESLYQDHD